MIAALLSEATARVVLSRIHDRKYDKSLIVPKLYAPTDGLRANATGEVWGKPFHTDEIGGRRHIHIRSGVPRVLILGDEVTQGVGVDDRETFANLINEKSKMDVRNISLIGLCTPDYLRLLEDFSYDDDNTYAGVKLFYSLDDIYCKVRPGEMPPLSGETHLNRLSEILQRHCALYDLIYLWAHRTKTEKYLYDRSIYIDDLKVKGVVTDIARMDSFCRLRSIDFEVYILPYRSQLCIPYDDMPQKKLSYMLRDKSIKYHDLLTDMKAERRPGDLYLYADEVHLSAEGHRRVAESIKSE